MQTFPPDRDPELRRALALDPRAQAVLLSTMLGEHVTPGADRSAPGSTATATFKPVGVTTKRSVSGALICKPVAFPKHARMGADSRRLQIQLSHYAFDQLRQPRLPDAVADLEKAIEAHAPHRGIVTIPYPTPPRDWTIGTIRAVIDVAAAHLPAAVSAVSVMINQAPWRQRGVGAEIEVRTAYPSSPWTSLHDGPYFGRVCLEPDASPAFAEWLSMFRCESNALGVSLAMVDERIRQYNERQQETASPDDDDDDDLDDIERAARRTLHAGRLTSTERRIVDRYRELPGWQRSFLIRFLDKLTSHIGDDASGERA